MPPSWPTFISDNYDFSIGGACFPEVHPEAPDLDTDLTYLKSKVDAGAEFLITQLFFDNRVYFDFVEAARGPRASRCRSSPGIIPVTGFAHTKTHLRALRLLDPAGARSGDAGRRRRSEAEFNLGVAYAAQQSAELLAAGAPGIHFYALNKAPATRAVLGALRAARPWLAAHCQAWTAGRDPLGESAAVPGRPGRPERTPRRGRLRRRG